jgi:hypothetical protein
MKIHSKIVKTVIIVSSSIVLAVVIIILFISPIAKHMAIKYGEKYTGRHITMGLVYVNPFTGYIHISDLKIYESTKLPTYTQGDSIFISANGLSANFALLKLLSNSLVITNVTLDQPRGVILQNKNELNFTDLIKAFTPKTKNTKPSSFHFTILRIKIKNGEFHYREDVTPINYFIKNVNIESTGKRWNSDTLALKYSFVSGPSSGTSKGNFSINFKTLDYRLSTVINKLDLNIIEQYLKPLINYGTFRADLDADIKATGNFRDVELIDAKGLLSFNDFHIGKDTSEDYAAFDQLVLQIIQLNPKNHKYIFDSLSLKHPYFKYERYDHLDNLQMMFGKNGTNLSEAGGSEGKFNLIVTIARYIKDFPERIQD